MFSLFTLRENLDQFRFYELSPSKLVDMYCTSFFLFFFSFTYFAPYEPTTSCLLFLIHATINLILKSQKNNNFTF